MIYCLWLDQGTTFVSYSDNTDAERQYILEADREWMVINLLRYKGKHITHDWIFHEIFPIMTIELS